MITSFRHDSQRSARRKKILVVVLGVALLTLVFRSPVEGFLSTAFQFIARPLLVIENNIREGIGSYAYIFTTKASLFEENVRLKNILDRVALDAYAGETLRAENEELKLMLGRHTGRTLLLARVLANPGIAPYDTLIIDVGSNDGITQGMKVFIDGDFVIGEATRIFARSAVVTLYSTKGNELPVTISKNGTSSVSTIAYGIGGGNFRSVLPKGTDITLGDLVHIPSIAPQYAGAVGAVVKREGSSLQEIYFKLPVNIYVLRSVYIATSEEVVEKIVK